MTEPTELNAGQLALAAFHERLKQAAAFLSNGDDRTGVQLSVVAIIEFIRSIPSLGSPEHLEPLRKLLDAFNDVDDGIVPPLFDPGKRRSGRPLDPTSHRTLKGYAAGTMELLMDCLDRSKEEASRLVAVELHRQKIQIGNIHNLTIEAASMTVASWRDRARGGSPDKDHDTFIYYDFINGTKPMVIGVLQQSGNRSVVEKKVIEALRGVCQQVRGSPKKTS